MKLMKNVTKITKEQLVKIMQTLKEMDVISLDEMCVAMQIVDNDLIVENDKSNNNIG